MHTWSRRFLLNAAVAGLASLAAHTAAIAQDAANFPQRPIKVIVPYPAGGVVDVTARAVTEALATQWGQPVVVENKPGANGNLGAEAVRHAKADGYTLLVGSMFTVINPLSDRNTRFQTSDFQPIAAIGSTPNLWAVPANSPFDTLDAFIAHAKQQPVSLNVANPGLGTSNHLGIDRLATETGIELTHINYQGQPQFIADLINGRLDIAPVTAALALPHVQSGKLKVLAVIGNTRLDALPGVPTLAELGLANAVVVPWNGIMAPAGTPAAIVNTIAQAVAQAHQAPQVLARYDVLKAQAPAPNAVFSDLVSQESARWARVFSGQVQLASNAAKASVKN